MHRKLMLAILFAALCFTSGKFGLKAYSSQITVPAGQTIQAIVTTPINSQNLSFGQTVTMVFGEDFYYNNKLIVPSDSVLTGNVISVSSATSKESGKLFLRFTQVTTPYGIKVPIAAVVKTDDKTGKLTGKNYDLQDENSNINIPVNTQVDLLLTQPITVNPASYNQNY